MTEYRARLAGHTLARQVAAFALACVEGSVPEEVRRSARLRVADSIGISIAASPLATSVAVLEHAVYQGGRPEATAIGTSRRLPTPLAALANGTFAHSLDYDDTHLPSVVHPSATVVPAVLAAAEALGAPGRATVNAVAAGLEICARLGMVGYDPEGRNSVYFDRGQHATSICGAISAAAAVSALSGLSEDGVVDAMGIAASMASGIIEGNRTGGTVKRVHCGWAAHAAVTAADLARRGITGPAAVFEGRFGLFQAFLGAEARPNALVAGLGDAWEVPRIFFKPYPANHFTHAGIDAAAALRTAGLRPADVAELHLGVARPTVPTIGEPIEQKRKPETGYQAQFSGPYTVAASLIGGHGLGLGLDDFTDELAREPARRELMARVSVYADEQCSQIFPEEFPAVLTAVTRDGVELRQEVMHLRGGPARPLSPAEVAQKFTDNAGRVCGQVAVSTILERIQELDRLPAVDLGLGMVPPQVLE